MAASTASLDTSGAMTPTVTAATLSLSRSAISEFTSSAVPSGCAFAICNFKRSLLSEKEGLAEEASLGCERSSRHVELLHERVRGFWVLRLKDTSEVFVTEVGKKQADAIAMARCERVSWPAKMDSAVDEGPEHWSYLQKVR